MNPVTAGHTGAGVSLRRCHILLHAAPILRDRIGPTYASVSAFQVDTGARTRFTGKHGTRGVIHRLGRGRRRWGGTLLGSRPPMRAAASNSASASRWVPVPHHQEPAKAHARGGETSRKNMKMLG